jgi:hypothetical protein
VQLDALRIAAGEADVLATVTLEWFDKGTGGDADQLQLERLAYLLGLIARATTAVVAAVDRFHAALADAQPADGGDQWDREDAGKPGPVPFAPVDGGADAGVGGPAKDEHPRR